MRQGLVRFYGNQRRGVKRDTSKQLELLELLAGAQGKGKEMALHLLAGWYLQDDGYAGGGRGCQRASEPAGSLRAGAQKIRCRPSFWADG